MNKAFGGYIIFSGAYGLYSVLVPLLFYSESVFPISVNTYLFIVICLGYLTSGILFLKFETTEWFYVSSALLFLQFLTINISSFAYEFFILAKIDLIWLFNNFKISANLILSNSFILGFNEQIARPFFAVNMVPLVIIASAWRNFKKGITSKNIYIN